MLLAAEGIPRAAAKAWSEAADQFDDQRWRLQAAGLLLQAGELSAALTTAENAISRSVPGWPGRRRAHAIAIDAAAGDQDWDAVTTHARQLLTLHDIPEVRWILAHALCHLDNAPDAWTVISRGGAIIAPVAGGNHRWHTGRQLELVSRFGTHEQLLSCAVDALREYGDDEAMAAQILGTVYTSESQRPEDFERSPEAPPALIDTFTALSEQFQVRFPDSAHFRALSFDPDHPEQLIATLTEQLAPRAAALEEVDAKIRAGELPTGALAMATNRSYAEIHLLRSADQGTFLRRNDATTLSMEASDLGTTLAGDDPAALIGATALHTLNWLSDATRGECLTTIDVQITRASFNDLRQARDGTVNRRYDRVHCSPLGSWARRRVWWHHVEMHPRSNRMMGPLLGPAGVR